MSCTAGRRSTSPSRVLQDSKRLYRKDNPTAIIVQNVTKMAGSEERGRQTSRARTLTNRVGRGSRPERMACAPSIAATKPTPQAACSPFTSVPPGRLEYSGHIVCTRCTILRPQPAHSSLTGMRSTDDQHMAGGSLRRRRHTREEALTPVSYTHLTLPTNREV